ncbi:urea transport system substrate-binding protein [Bradyrhizobium sp. USDA 4341]
MNVKGTRRDFLKTGAAALASPYFFGRTALAADTLNVGVVFSLTGVTSIIEKSLADATLMAISEINAQGGVLSKQVKVIQEDGASDPKTYAEKASKLVVRDKLGTVFGGLTSASRKAVLPIFERRNSLFFYPTYYEGYECSRNVIYGGAVPNQQLSNFIPWIIKNLGKKKFFIVGSNYIYPQEMAKVCKILIKENGAEWIADEHLELGDSEWGAMVNKIKNSGCDAVISNVVGDSVVAFYREYKNQGLTHDKLPICATVTSEIEIAAMGAEYAVGGFTSFPYFQAIDSTANRSFIERYRKFVKDPKAVTHHAMECAYTTVFLWKKAVEKAGEATPDAIREAIRGQEFDAPDGKVKIERENLHTWLTPRIAQWQSDGQGKIVDEFKSPIMPLPYAAYGERENNLFCKPSGLDTTKLKT